MYLQSKEDLFKSLVTYKKRLRLSRSRAHLRGFLAQYSSVTKFLQYTSYTQLDVAIFWDNAMQYSSKVLSPFLLFLSGLQQRRALQTVTFILPDFTQHFIVFLGISHSIVSHFIEFCSIFCTCQYSLVFCPFLHSFDSKHSHDSVSSKNSRRHGFFKILLLLECASPCFGFNSLALKNITFDFLGRSTLF